MYSFDVFDTLITRKTAVPEGIFAIMQSELEREEYAEMPVSIRNNFYRLRIAAERLARDSYQRDGTEDVTLEQIYDALAVRGELSKVQQKRLICLECDIEYRECVPVEKNVIQVKKLLSEGNKVILISDMYLPRKQISRMLAKADPVLARLQLYVSEDCKKRKRTGAIYVFAMERSHFTGAECIHTGDNEKTDVTAAEKAGFRSRMSWFPSLLPIEKALLGQAPADIWLNRIIGCSRRTRLALGEEMAQKEDIMTGISAGGIILNSYMQWVIRTALAKGIKGLYFTAPDGYVLKCIADILIRKTGAAIAIHYSNEAGSVKQYTDFTDDRCAFVVISERSCIQNRMADRACDSYHGCFQIFLFNTDQIIESDHCIRYVFYPGRICKGDLEERLCVISENRADYLTGIGKFTELFYEDGKPAVQFEDMEQISKMLACITEMPASGCMEKSNHDSS